MSKESYYDILEVPKDASTSDIKKAYRSLSLKYHPDRNQNNPDATSTFQKIGEAYETLSNDEKRKEYDSGGSNPHFHSGDPGNMNDLFNMMFGGMPMGGMPMGGMHMGGMPGGNGVHFFHGGMPGNGNPNIFFQNMQRPPAIVKNIHLTMEQSFFGLSIPIDIERNNHSTKSNEKETLYIPIPAGIDNNEIIVVKDKGHFVNENIKGDVKLVIQITKHPLFERHGLDLIYKKQLSLKDSLCGFSFDITHVNGKILHLTNNTNHTIIKPNYKKFIPGMGFNRETNKGNLVVEFEVSFPNSLTEQQITTLKEIL